MDFGQLRKQNQQSARSMMYQNPLYDFERKERKTVILDVADTAAKDPLSSATEFSVIFFEPLLVDKLSDVYIDSVLTHNSMVCHTADKMAFSLSINEFSVNSNCASSTDSNQSLFNRILIPNDHSNIADVHSCVVHKGKKMNYVCSLNPCRLSKLSGKVTSLSGGSMFANTSTADGGVIHYIKLDTGLTTFVPSGSSVSISGNTGTFETSFDMAKESVDLYFYSTGGTISGNTSTTLDSNTITVNGVSGIDTADGTYRRGDFPRMIVEFVIISRD